ncbi:MAG TPA: hypothetical protein VF095_03525 [Bacillota bacterium]
MNKDDKHIYNLCKEHMHSYVLAEMKDGSKVDGIITGLDDEYVYFAVPIEGENMPARPILDDYNRQFGFPGYGYGYGGYGFPSYGYFGPYGFPPRRFRRLVLPLAALAALSILPWY